MGILKRMRNKYKGTNYGGTWLKWFKRKVKGPKQNFNKFPK